MKVEKLLPIIRSARLDLSNEKRAQEGLAEVFDVCLVAFRREVRLSAGDIPDFMVGDVAVELKLKGARKMDIYRQLCRYAKHDCVKHIVLATNVTMGLPPQLEGKPVYFISLGQAWL
ncbi:MAG: hypothetical protein ACAH80_13615 [Alphaproteobacteria bacterium]